MASSSSAPKKRNVSEALKKTVAASQKWQCNICHELLESTFQVDHIRDLQFGGSNARDNLQALCVGCHAKKTQEAHLRKRQQFIDALQGKTKQRRENYCARCEVTFSVYFNHSCGPVNNTNN